MTSVLRPFAIPALVLTMLVGAPAIANAACLICDTVTQCSDDGSKCKSVTTCHIEHVAALCQ